MDDIKAIIYAVIFTVVSVLGAYIAVHISPPYDETNWIKKIK